MKKFTMFACLALALVFALSSFAGDLPRVTRGNSTLHGGSVSFQKAGLDTINLMAAADDPTNQYVARPGEDCFIPEPHYRADFEMGDDMGMVGTDGTGWTSVDITQPVVTHWQISDYDGFNTYPSLRAWCGDISFASCSATDPDGGYGNSWNDLLVFNKAVVNNAVSSGVNITALLQYDTEPGYDYVYLSANLHDQDFMDLGVWDGQSQDGFGAPAPIQVAGSLTYLTADYINGTDVSIYWRFRSDGAWSDEDCSFAGAGACQIDDIQVAITNDGNNYVYTEDFEDSSFGPDWAIEYPDGVGDYARIYRNLEDNDPCNTNYTAQVAFIDDGVVVPGTGGSQCINWCYGPGGYIVTTTGGLAGDTEHIYNAIESPVMQWPTAKSCSDPIPDGIIMNFGVYRHEDLTADAPGIFYTWGVRSAAPGDDITAAAWLDRNFVYYGGPDYVRGGDDVTDLMVESRDRVQVQLAVYELGFQWFWTGNDGYPAPFFDNVTVKIFPYFGPGFSTREIDLANDNWPARGTIDYGDLPSHSVRFDMANNISLATHLRNDPGDTMVVDVVPVRAGSELMENPRLHYHMQRNPIFDGGRTSGLADIGSVLGMPAVNSSGQVVPDKWAFDLPDTGFLFPGDVLHYYIGATDQLPGGVDPQAATLPADTTGFSDGFGDPMGYNSTYVIRALPSIVDDGFGGYTHPNLLFLNDFANRGGENEWYMSLNNIGLLVEEDYDVYYTNGPSSGVGNGIGGRANDLLLTGYTDIMYTSGNLGVNTIANGDFQNDAGDDVGVLTAWLDQGDKDMFLTGDDLVSDLAQAGVATLRFAENYLGLSLSTSNVRSFIGNQTTPLVYAIAGNPVFNGTLQSWIAFGGCNAINTFDGVNVTNGGVRIAEFNDPTGIGYSFAAATLKTGVGSASTSRTVSMPVDLMYIHTDPAAGGTQLPARAQLLKDVLAYFGIQGDPTNVSAVETIPGLTFKTSNYPNPFNPSTTIKYSMPKAGHLTLNVYNVRGQLVKTLIDGNRPAGADQTIVWDGTNNQGSNVSSGVYFYEARTGGEVTVQKMALVK